MRNLRLGGFGYFFAVRTRWRISLLIVAIAGIAFVALTARLFIWPQTDVPRRAGAIVVLGSDPVNEMRRVQEGKKLLLAGDAPVMAISEAGQPCSLYAAPRVICFSARPDSTQGEARYIGRMARLRHWHSVIVVAGRPQVSRARLRVERCFTGSVAMVGVDPTSFEQWVYQVAYEWGATIKALTVQRGC